MMAVRSSKRPNAMGEGRLEKLSGSFPHSVQLGSVTGSRQPGRIGPASRPLWSGRQFSHRGKVGARFSELLPTPASVPPLEDGTRERSPLPRLHTSRSRPCSHTGLVHGRGDQQRGYQEYSAGPGMPFFAAARRTQLRQAESPWREIRGRSSRRRGSDGARRTKSRARARSDGGCPG